MLQHRERLYILPLFHKSNLRTKVKCAKKLARMLILLYCLLFVGLIIFANASRQLGPFTSCRDREDVCFVEAILRINNVFSRIVYGRLSFGSSFVSLCYSPLSVRVYPSLLLISP